MELSDNSEYSEYSENSVFLSGKEIELFENSENSPRTPVSFQNIHSTMKIASTAEGPAIVRQFRIF